MSQSNTYSSTSTTKDTKNSQTQSIRHYAHNPKLNPETKTFTIIQSTTHLTRKELDQLDWFKATNKLPPESMTAHTEQSKQQGRKGFNLLHIKNWHQAIAACETLNSILNNPAPRRRCI